MEPRKNKKSGLWENADITKESLNILQNFVFKCHSYVCAIVLIIIHDK